MRTLRRLGWAAALLAAVSCAEKKTEPVPTPMTSKTPPLPPPPPASIEMATFGAGCFWCVEAVFQKLEGVHLVESGYSGGTVDNPTYEDVCTGTTGHAEVCRITYDPSKLSYAKLLEVFFKTHDPTTLNRQGNDKGTQYRSVIYHHTPEQKELAERVKRDLDASGAWGQPIVTEISPSARFFKAEEHHQNYFVQNPNQGYCRFIIAPKVDKVRKVFADLLKKGE